MTLTVSAVLHGDEAQTQDDESAHNRSSAERIFYLVEFEKHARGIDLVLV